MKKSKGRHERPEEKPAARKAVKREYTSYEEAPLYDDELTATPKNFTRLFIKVLLILMLSVLAVIAFLNRENLTADKISHWFQYDLLGKSEGNGYPVRFTGVNILSGNFSLMDQSPVYCSDTSVVVLNGNAGEYQSKQHTFANPVLRTNDNYAIVFNLDDRSFLILDRTTVRHSDCCEQKLFDADIASNGTYGLLSYGDDFLSTLTVYKGDNTKKYGYSFANYYVSKLSLKQDGTRAAACGVSAKNGEMISAVYILDFEQSEYFQKHEIEDAFLYDVKYLDNGNVVAVGDRSAYYIDVADNSMKEIEYGGKGLTAYCFHAKSGLELSLSANPDGRDCEVLYLDPEGSARVIAETGEKILSIDRKSDLTAVLTVSGIIVYDSLGVKLQTIPVQADGKKICLQDDHTLYLLGKSQITKVRLEY